MGWRALIGAGALASGPFLELLQRSPEFWISHDLAPAQGLCLALALLLGPGGIAALATAGLPRFARGPARLVCLAFLLALALLPSLARVFPGGAAAAPLLAALAAAGGAALVARVELARRVASALVVAVLVYAAGFAASGLLGRIGAGEDGAPHPPPPRPGPVVLAVFDELPLVSLLGRDGRIDAGRFPNFAALAADSIWFPDSSAAAGLTTLALPAILSGRHPDPAKLPLASDHPDNLLAWLAPQLALRVQEPRTRLLPRRLARAEREAVHAALLLSDLGLLYAHFALPAALARGLPPVDEDWLGFAAHGGADASSAAAAHEVAELRREARGRSRVAAFGEFVRSLEPCGGACLVFVHCVLPHVPWEYTPEARSYPTWAFTPGLSAREKRWDHEEAWVGEAWQRHLFQTVLVDRMLGSLVARLRRIGLYDPALLIVTADHGLSLWPGVRERALSGGHPHPSDLLRVPLFLRAPGLPRGAVDSRPAAAVDIAPTVAAFLGGALPWPHDGISLLAPRDPGARAAAARPPRLAVAVDGERIEVPDDLASRRASLELKQRLLPIGGGVAGLYARGPRAPALFDRELSALRVSAADGARAPRIELAGAALVPPGRVPLRVIGRLRGDPERAPGALGFDAVAAAVGGRIRAIAPLAAGSAAARAFSLFLPDALREQPFSALELYVVSGPPAAPLLVRAELRPGLALRELLVGSAGSALPPASEEVGDADAEQVQAHHRHTEQHLADDVRRREDRRHDEDREHRVGRAAPERGRIDDPRDREEEHHDGQLEGRPEGQEHVRRQREDVANGPGRFDEIAVEGREELEHRGEDHEVAEHRPAREERRRDAHEGDDRVALVRVQPGRDEGPDLPEEDRQREKQARERRALEIGEEDLRR